MGRIRCINERLRCYECSRELLTWVEGEHETDEAGQEIPSRTEAIVAGWRLVFAIPRTWLCPEHCGGAERLGAALAAEWYRSLVASKAPLQSRLAALLHWKLGPAIADLTEDRIVAEVERLLSGCRAEPEARPESER